MQYEQRINPVWFSYDVGPEAPRRAFPGQPVMRPLLDVRLESSRGAPVTTKLLVDSGSEYTLVTKVFARRLGILDLLSSDFSETILIGGQSLTAELFTVRIDVPSFDGYEATVGFVGNWTFAHSGVLGQRGFFDHFGVILDRPNLRFGLVRTEDFDQAFPPEPSVRNG